MESFKLSMMLQLRFKIVRLNLFSNQVAAAYFTNVFFENLTDLNAP